MFFADHGRGDSMSGQEAMTGFSKPSYNKKTIQVYLQGKGNQWQGDPAASATYDDVAFTRQVLSDLASKYCIDDSRVFASGSSNGGGFVANKLLCTKWGSSTFTVAASCYGAYYSSATEDECNAGKYTPNDVPIDCKNMKNDDIAFIELHGDGDTTIPYEGGARRGQCLPAIPYFVQEWATRLGHSSTNVSETLWTEKGISTKYMFGKGSKQGAVTHYRITDWGHAWPTKASGVDASKTVQEFFSEWGKGDGVAYTGPDSVSDKLVNKIDPIPSEVPVSSRASASRSAKASSTKHRSSKTSSHTSATPSASSKRHGSSSKTSSASSTAASPAASGTLITCPSANNTKITDNGKTFSIVCNIDHPGHDIGDGPKHFATFKQCMNSCVVTEGCVAVSFEEKSGNCFLKGRLSYIYKDTGVWAAKLLGAEFDGVPACHA